MRMPLNANHLFKGLRRHDDFKVMAGGFVREKPLLSSDKPHEEVHDIEPGSPVLRCPEWSERISRMGQYLHDSVSANQGQLFRFTHDGKKLPDGLEPPLRNDLLDAFVAADQTEQRVPGAAPVLYAVFIQIEYADDHGGTSWSEIGSNSVCLEQCVDMVGVPPLTDSVCVGSNSNV